MTLSSIVWSAGAENRFLTLTSGSIWKPITNRPSPFPEKMNDNHIQTTRSSYLYPVVDADGRNFEAAAPASHLVHLPIVPQSFLSMQDAQNLQATIGWGSGKWKVFVKYVQERDTVCFWAYYTNRLIYTLMLQEFRHLITILSKSTILYNIW